MSDPVLLLAEQIHAAPVKDGSPAEVLAKRLLDMERDYVAMSVQYVDLHKRLNAAVHERDELRDALGSVVRAARSEPELTIYCDEPDCTTAPITMQVAPPDDAVDGMVRGRGWKCRDNGYYCPSHHVPLRCECHARMAGECMCGAWGQ